MAKLSKIFRGLSMVMAILVCAAVTTGVIMEQYPSSLDTYFGTLSSRVVSEESSEADWIFESDFKSAKEAYEGLKEFSIRASAETFALLKNEKDALPLDKNANITLLGLRSYAAIYGNNGGSTPDTSGVEDNTIYDAFAAEGFNLNPEMLNTYATYCSDLTWAPSSFGSSTPSYRELNVTDDIPELSLSELQEINPNYASLNSQYNDAAIVVVGRPGGETYEYRSGTKGLTGMDSSNYPDSGNIMGLSQEEKEIINYAKNNFDNVIVLVNSVCQLEIDDLKNDPDIDAIMWIGYPGAYGFVAVAQVLNGTVAPSGHLGDFYAVNTAVNPAMMNVGDDTEWQNMTTTLTDSNVNSYLVEAEGIYTGYRYYETRYADAVMGTGNATRAAAGQYITDSGTVGTSDGTWKYENEVSYSFGYGLSYTTFEQTLNRVTIYGNKKTAEVSVTSKNIGDVAGKDVIQLYAQTPYTTYDKNYNVEKSAIQLMDFEKTELLEPGESQTIIMDVDLANLASYDYTHAKTYIVDNGDYYFALGTDAHDALNNVLAAQGYTVANGMTEDGNEDLTYMWTWGDAEDDVDSVTFSVSSTGAEITNALSDGRYAMDYNAFEPGTVTYLSRSDWYGTYPVTYSGFKADATDMLYEQLTNDFYTLHTNDDTSEYVWGSTATNYQLSDMKQADWDDERWDDIVDQVTIDEFLTFASNAFHNIQEIPSVGYAGNNADDGPGGSDSHYLNEGSYQGVAYEDAADYADYGTRTGPSATNLAYSFNKELAYEQGNIILGESTLALGLAMMCGPGMNLHRHAYNGRGGEYYSEDPMLSGYIGSNVIQGAQQKGCLVNIKHAAFNDQEINRSGIAVFMNEQKAREIELRNLQQAVEGTGKPASFRDDEAYDNTFIQGAFGIMTSYNRIGATASSANYGAMVQILRDEWGFQGYNVTDFTSVSLRAAPKESILFGTTAFCGFGVSINYWTTNDFINDANECAAIKLDIKYILYSLANTAAVNGTNNTTHREQLWSTWRIMYTTFEIVAGCLLGICVVVYAVTEIIPATRKKKDNEKQED